MAIPTAPAHLRAPTRAVWVVPVILAAVCASCAIVATLAPEHSRLWGFIPFTFLGNSLAMVPYDAAVIYLGEFYPVWLVVVVGTLATMLIEVWNMEILSRILVRDGARHFREHRATQWTLDLYRKAPFVSLVATCILPLVPHYPMRIIATLAGYPMWKYQGAVALGRSGRYLGLALVGWAVAIPASWLVLASLVVVLAMLRTGQAVNRQKTPEGEPA